MAPRVSPGFRAVAKTAEKSAKKMPRGLPEAEGTKAAISGYRSISCVIHAVVSVFVKPSQAPGTVGSLNHYIKDRERHCLCKPLAVEICSINFIILKSIISKEFQSLGLRRSRHDMEGLVIAISPCHPSFIGRLTGAAQWLS